MANLNVLNAPNKAVNVTLNQKRSPNQSMSVSTLSLTWRRTMVPHSHQSKGHSWPYEAKAGWKQWLIQSPHSYAPLRLLQP
jgi:hypothetical protein